MRVLIALALLALAAPAQAQSNSPADEQNMQIGAGLVCDTPEQTRRYVELFRGDAKAAADAVNAEVGKEEACTFGVIAFIRGEDVERARSFADETVQIAEVLVLGVGGEAGLMRINPVRWYTIFAVKETAI
jgi:hypothetical protein